ncbi:hypothetical protein niasHT_039653 [Heterodera trifolii]|uniref:Uncharacterized protein n=1 Tax=Heterodera trifolii TaxID=157864 RepID=A0ABD2IC88_9BILA
MLRVLHLWKILSKPFSCLRLASCIAPQGLCQTVPVYGQLMPRPKAIDCPHSLLSCRATPIPPFSSKIGFLPLDISLFSPLFLLLFLLAFFILFSAIKIWVPSAEVPIESSLPCDGNAKIGQDH